MNGEGFTFGCNLDICPVCDGDAKQDGQPCEWCNGDGRNPYMPPLEEGTKVPRTREDDEA